MTDTDTVAPILADMFSAAVLGGLQEKPPRTFLYIWEREALAWLNAWRAAGGDVPISAWTDQYMRHGPPPWRRRPADRPPFEPQMPTTRETGNA